MAIHERTEIISRGEGLPSGYERKENRLVSINLAARADRRPVIGGQIERYERVLRERHPGRVWKAGSSTQD